MNCSLDLMDVISWNFSWDLYHGYRIGWGDLMNVNVHVHGISE